MSKQDRNYDNINELRRQISVNDDQIEALEKTISTHHDISLVQTKEISELRKQFIEKNRGINSNTVNDNAKLREMINVDLKKHSKDIVELQDQITELKESLRALGGFSNEYAYDISNMEGILWEHYKEHKRIQDDNVYSETFPIDQTWEDHLNKGLKKLEGENASSASHTERPMKQGVMYGFTKEFIEGYDKPKQEALEPHREYTPEISNLVSIECPNCDYRHDFELPKYFKLVAKDNLKWLFTWCRPTDKDPRTLKMFIEMREKYLSDKEEHDD